MADNNAIPRTRYRPSQARPGTFEQLRQYVWQELQHIGFAINNTDDTVQADECCLDLCDGITNPVTEPCVVTLPEGPLQSELLVEGAAEYDGGANVQPSSAGIFGVEGNHICAWLESKDGGTPGLYTSTDGGDSWSDVVFLPRPTEVQFSTRPFKPWEFYRASDGWWLYSYWSDNRESCRYFSSDNTNWSDYPWPPFNPGTTYASNQFSPRAFAPDGANFIHVTRFVESPDGGSSNWLAVTRRDLGTGDAVNVTPLELEANGGSPPVRMSNGWAFIIQSTTGESEQPIYHVDNNLNVISKTEKSAQSYVSVLSNDNDTMFWTVLESSSVHYWKTDGSVGSTTLPGAYGGTYTSLHIAKKPYMWLAISSNNTPTARLFASLDQGVTWTDSYVTLTLSSDVHASNFRNLQAGPDEFWFFTFKSQDTRFQRVDRFVYETTTGDCWLDGTAGPQDGDILEYYPATGEWCTGRRTRMIPEGYTPGASYQRGDEVSNGVQISEALIDGATESPYIAPDGDPFYVYAGTPTTVSPTAKQVIFGNRWQTGRSGYLAGYRLYTQPGYRYVVYTVADPLGTPILSTVQDLTGSADGWVDLAIDPTTVVAGEAFDLVAVVTQPDLDPSVVVQADYDYQTPNNARDPLDGEVVHADRDMGVLYVSKTDNGGGTPDLTFLTVGDTISALAVTWAIQSITDSGSFWAYEIAPVTQGTPDGVTQFSFEGVAPVVTTVHHDPDYWTNNPPELGAVQGLYGADTPYPSIVPNGTYYAVEPQFQYSYVPTEWKVKVVADGTGTGGDGGSGTGVTARSYRFWRIVNATAALPGPDGVSLDEIELFATNVSGGDSNVAMSSTVTGTTQDAGNPLDHLVDGIVNDAPAEVFWSADTVADPAFNITFDFGDAPQAITSLRMYVASATLQGHFATFEVESSDDGVEWLRTYYVSYQYVDGALPDPGEGNFYDVWTERYWLETTYPAAATGGGGWWNFVFPERDADFTAVAGDMYFINNTGTITVTLPATPNLGDKVGLTKTVSDFNTVLVDLNGQLAYGINYYDPRVPEFVPGTSGAWRFGVSFIYTGAARGWVAFDDVGQPNIVG